MHGFRACVFSRNCACLRRLRGETTFEGNIEAIFDQFREIQREASLLVLQATFTVINVIGIYRWLGA